MHMCDTILIGFRSGFSQYVNHLRYNENNYLFGERNS